MRKVLKVYGAVILDTRNVWILDFKYSVYHRMHGSTVIHSMPQGRAASVPIESPERDV